MPKTSIPAAAEGMPFAYHSVAVSIRRFANRCRAAITAFKYAGNAPEYLVVYERTGFKGDFAGNPMFTFGGFTPEDAATDFAETTLRWTREAGGECERARVVLVVGCIKVDPRLIAPIEASANV